MLNAATPPDDKGFTLLETLIVVALLAVVAAIGIPVYNGYITSTKESVAENNLRSVHLMELDYYSENGKYYVTPSGDQTRQINNILFSGSRTLDEGSDYYYHIQASGSGYRARAVPRQSGTMRQYCRDNNNSVC